MSYLSPSGFDAYLHDLDGNADIAPAKAQAMDAAQGAIAKFIGFDPEVEFEDGIPAEIVSAGYILAGIEYDANDVPREQQLRARAESLLRPYRREVGFAGSGCEVAA